ncbi:MAG: hypothetical protein PHS38_12655 [Bacteroidales bacterium]|nr:hypothetical protein [Bacteroidales bacterium]
MSHTTPLYSINPDGEKFPIPEKKDFQPELERLTALANQARKKGQEVVVVMGAGFVGAVMSAVVAGTKDKHGKPSKFVIVCQRPSKRSYWKIIILP